MSKDNVLKAKYVVFEFDDRKSNPQNIVDIMEAHGASNVEVCLEDSKGMRVVSGSEIPITHLEALLVTLNILRKETYMIIKVTL